LELTGLIDELVVLIEKDELDANGGYTEIVRKDIVNVIPSVKFEGVILFVTSEDVLPYVFPYAHPFVSPCVFPFVKFEDAILFVTFEGEILFAEVDHEILFVEADHGTLFVGAVVDFEGVEHIGLVGELERFDDEQGAVVVEDVAHDQTCGIV